LVFLSALTAQENSKRYALLIGNENYRQGKGLLTPINDVRDVGDILSDYQYEVTILYDATLAEIENAIIEFGNKLEADKTSEGFFWFAGHGSQFQGTNYLIPIEASIDSPNDFSRETYSLNRLLGQLEDADNKVNIVVLDACRTNNFSFSSRQYELGLGQIDNDVIPSSSYIIYSTGANEVALDFAIRGMTNGRNSPFTQAFIKEMINKQPFDDVFKNITIETNRITGGYQTPHPYGQILIKDYALYSSEFLSPTPEKGTLQVSLSDKGILIINGKYYNIAKEDLVLIDLPLGEYNIGVQWEYDKEIQYKDVVINSGATTRIQFNWERKWSLRGIEKLGIDFGMLPIPDLQRFYIGMPYKNTFEPNRLFFLLPNSFSAHVLISNNVNAITDFQMDMSLLEASWNIPIPNPDKSRLILNFGIAGSLLYFFDESVEERARILPTIGFPINISFRVTPNWDIVVFSKFFIPYENMPPIHEALYDNLTVGFRWSDD
jgi:hypothetical protein